MNFYLLCGFAFTFTFAAVAWLALGVLAIRDRWRVRRARRAVPDPSSPFWTDPHAPKEAAR